MPNPLMTPNTFVEELKGLLNDPRTGLRNSSDTNKTYNAILALFESALSEAYGEGEKDYGHFPMNDKNWHREDFDFGGEHYACVIREDSTPEQVKWINFAVFKKLYSLITKSHDDKK